MRKAHLLLLLVGALFLLAFAPTATTAPALGDKPHRYEYAELTLDRVLERPAQFGGGPGGPGGGQVAGQAGGPAGGRGMGRVSTTIRWTTWDEEIEVKQWSDLADKLKAPTPKKEVPASSHKLRVLNRLSELGWELLDRPFPDAGGNTLAFRRKLP
jgi:hypothetical protein